MQEQHITRLKVTRIQLGCVREFSVPEKMRNTQCSSRFTRLIPTIAAYCALMSWLTNCARVPDASGLRRTWIFQTTTVRFLRERVRHLDHFYAVRRWLPLAFSVFFRKRPEVNRPTTRDQTAAEWQSQSQFLTIDHTNLWWLSIVEIKHTRIWLIGSRSVHKFGPFSYL